MWMCWLDLPGEVLANFSSTLNRDESERAQRFRFDRDRHRFIVSRGVLRMLLGRYLNCDPDQIDITYSLNGKPEVGGDLADRALQFNVAHSGGLALLAFTNGRLIGVDIEKHRPLPDAGELADRFFSAKEYMLWSSLSPDYQLEAFFRYWTCKEAFIKALGTGLSYPLDQFDVELGPKQQARLVTIAGDENLAKQWSVRELNPAPGYSAAIVAQNDWNLLCWRWE